MSIELEPTLPIEVKSHELNVDFNLGLALPFRYHKSKGGVTSINVVSSIDKKTGNYLNIKLEGGRLGPLENDVLMVWCSLAREQEKEGLIKNTSNRKRVFYTISQLCERLRLSVNTRSRIKKAIKNLLEYKVKTKNYALIKETCEVAYTSENMSLITKHGDWKRMYQEDGETVKNGTFWVEFDETIMNNLTMGMVSVITEEEYFRLKSGAERRAKVFINSKKRAQGNRFIFDIKELIDILGYEEENKRKLKFKVNKLLKKVSDENKIFKYTILSNSQGKTDVYIEFNEVELLDNPTRNEFFEDLCLVYGENNIRDYLNLDERDVVILLEELSRKWKIAGGSETITAAGCKNTNPAEFIIDLLFHQVINTTYNLTGKAKNLAYVILDAVRDESYKYPEKYQYFVRENAKRIRDKEHQKAVMETQRIQNEIKETEEKEKRETFDSIYDGLLANDKHNEFMTQLRSKAHDFVINELNIKQTNSSFGLALESKLRDLTFEMFNAGELDEMVKIQ